MSTDQANVNLDDDVRGLHDPLFYLDRDVPHHDVAVFLDSVDGHRPVETVRWV